MTVQQALAKLEADNEAIRRALSNLETVRALQAVGEEEKALELYGVTRLVLSLQLRKWEES